MNKKLISREMEELLHGLEPVQPADGLKSRVIADAEEEWRRGNRRVIAPTLEPEEFLTRFETIQPDSALKGKILSHATAEWRKAASADTAQAQELEAFLRRIESPRLDASLKSRVLAQSKGEWRRTPSLRRFVSLPMIIKLAASVAATFIILSQPVFHRKDLNLDQMLSVFQSKTVAGESFGRYERFCEEIDLSKDRARVTVKFANLSGEAKQDQKEADLIQQ